MAFENLNVPQLAVLPSPLASLFAMNAVSGAVLHIGREASEVNIVYDSIVRWEATATVDVGEVDCERHLEKLLLADEKLDKELKSVAGVESFAPGQKEQYVKEIREFIFAECVGDDIEVPIAKTAVKAAVVTSNKKPEEEDDAFDVAKKLTADAVPQAIPNPSHKSNSARTPPPPPQNGPPFEIGPGNSARLQVKYTRTVEARRAAVGAARAASRPSSGSPGGQFAASFKQTQSPAAQGLAPRNTPSRTTPTLRQPTRQLYNFSTTAEAADVIVVTIPSLPEKEITVGSVRHRLAEPLLFGTKKGGDTVWEAIGRAIEHEGLNTWERLTIWGSIGVIGNMARFKCKFTRQIRN
ncbi:RNA polymerase II transcription factor [Trichosporon asahii var. asahii CBS 8904]|uniref:RNA polymerase II transcription factor n=1 Tax=Trichosporon asahii var. asahii (strain CBS 8904) TaxID=1220162 RepID=K1WBE1_TRIAC|nr:RNA polymerase II transcription factor [Trichosporon asahii var. asahii CBS 8904]